MKEIKEKIKKVFESKKVLSILLIIGILVILSLIFQAGVYVGFHKASFGRDWGENYGRNLGMMGGRGYFNWGRGGMMGNFPNAYGVTGKIIKIELPTMIVQDRDNTEKVVFITDTTKIINIRNDVDAKDLVVDENIIVVGSPNTQGQIEAKLIRIMPFPTLNSIKQ